MARKYFLASITTLFVLLFSTSAMADTVERYQAKSKSGENTVYFDCFNFEGTNYISLRDIAGVLRNTEDSFSIDFNNKEQALVINKKQNYTLTGVEFSKSIGRKKSKQTAETVSIDCEGTMYSVKAYNINNKNYVMLRDICNIINIDTIWNAEAKTIELWTNYEYGENFNLTSITILPPVIVDRNKPMVALTFDDGPSANTERILNTLEKYNGVATFFVTGNCAEKNTATLRRIINEESQIGNHTYDHLRLTTLSADGIKSQVNRIQDIVYNATGVYPTVLRPPYGEYNSFVKSNINLKMFNWNVDTLDWKTRNSQSTYNEVMNTLADGNVILMHDLYSQTADAVDKIVPALVEKGYQLVTIDQLCYAKDNVMGRIK